MPRRRADGRGPHGSGRGVATGRFKASRGAQAGRPCARPSRRSPDALQRATRRPGPADRLDEPDGRLLATPVRRSRGSAQTDGPMKKAKKEAGVDSPARLIDARIKELGDWRGEMLARIRKLIKQADPEVIEEWKWRGVPV